MLRHRLATLLSPSLMLVGTVYLFTTMPTGFIPSQDSGFFFAFTMASAGHLVRVDGEASAARSREIVRARPECRRTSGAFRDGRQPGLSVRAH